MREYEKKLFWMYRFNLITNKPETQIKFLLLAILIGLVCCIPKQSEESIVSELIVKDLDSDGIVHDKLTTKQILEIKRIHSAFIEVNSHSLEETIINFKRHQDPDREIAVWLRMADVYERFTLNKHIEEYDKKYEANQLILLRSTMSEEDVMGQMKFTYLTTDEVKEILSYCVDPPHLNIQ